MEGHTPPPPSLQNYLSTFHFPSGSGYFIIYTPGMPVETSAALRFVTGVPRLALPRFQPRFRPTGSPRPLRGPRRRPRSQRPERPSEGPSEEAVVETSVETSRPSGGRIPSGPLEPFRHRPRHPAARAPGLLAPAVRRLPQPPDRVQELAAPSGRRRAPDLPPREVHQDPGVAAAHTILTGLVRPSSLRYTACVPPLILSMTSRHRCQVARAGPTDAQISWPAWP